VFPDQVLSGRFVSWTGLIGEIGRDGLPSDHTEDLTRV
jgi:hypothetical protein